MKNITLSPEMLSVDVTFGINKEKLSLLRFCNVDSVLKVFPAFHCFIPSEQFRAFDWVCRIAFPKLVGEENLRANTLITSDQELPLMSGIRSMMSYN